MVQGNSGGQRANYLPEPGLEEAFSLCVGARRRAGYSAHEGKNGFPLLPNGSGTAIIRLPPEMGGGFLFIVGGTYEH